MSNVKMSNVKCQMPILAIDQGVSDHLKFSSEERKKLKTSVCADKSQYIYENQNVHLFNDEITREFFLMTVMEFSLFFGVFSSAEICIFMAPLNRLDYFLAQFFFFLYIHEKVTFYCL